MKNLFLFLLLATTATQAQPLTRNDIVGTYEISKLYLNDTLFYDKANPEKSNKNVLIDVGKQIAIYNDREDSTLAIALFYKDIKKALSTIIVFNADSTTKATSSTYGYLGDDTFTRLNYTEHWNFNKGKQKVEIIRNGRVTERMPAKKVNGVVTLYIDDKKEKTKLELVKMY